MTTISNGGKIVRYSLFTNIEDAVAFVLTVQVACDAVWEKLTPEEKGITPHNIIKPFFLTWNQKWVVSIPVEPEVLQGEVVDSVEPPIIEGEGV